MARLNPYLQFNGKCREAMNFYRECLVRRSSYAVHISTRTVPTLFASNRSTYAGCYLHRI